MEFLPESVNMTGSGKAGSQTDNLICESADLSILHLDNIKLPDNNKFEVDYLKEIYNERFQTALRSVKFFRK